MTKAKPTLFKKIQYRAFVWSYRVGEIINNNLTSSGKTLFWTIFTCGLFLIDPQSTLTYQLFATGSSVLVISAFFSKRQKLQARIFPPQTIIKNSEICLNIESEHNNYYSRIKLDFKLPTFEEFLNIEGTFITSKKWYQELDRRKKVYLKPISNSQICLKAAKRGVIHAQLELAIPDPFGLTVKYSPASDYFTIYILPEIYPIKNNGFGSGHDNQQFEISNKVGDSFEIKNLRNYSPGDPIKTIHWKNSSKLGKFIVKELEEENTARMAVILDVYGKNYKYFEEAVTITSSLILAEEQNSIETIIAGEDYVSGGGHLQVEQVLKLLASITPQEGSLEETKITLKHNINEIFGCICIFTEWEKEQKDFIDYLNKFNLPVKIIVISENPLEVPTIHPQKLREGIAKL